MKTEIVVTGILKSKDHYLIVERADDDYDETYPSSAWEFPGGHLEEGETIIQALKRELKEEIDYDLTGEPKITNFYDEIRDKNGGNKSHFIELDFFNRSSQRKQLPSEIEPSSTHPIRGLRKIPEYMIDFLKRKIQNII